MKIAMVGAGYVGLVTGSCFADSGNEVWCVDIDQAKIEKLTRGEIPIFEPGLAEMVLRNVEMGRLHFTTDLAQAVGRAEIVYLAVGTPQANDGSADLSALWSVVAGLAEHLPSTAITVVKSTVPVGTNAKVYERLRELTDRDCEVASNPEFLKEGAAIDDFTEPDRVVVGVRSRRAAEVLEQLYRPFLEPDRPFLTMSPESAELTKYVANALLSTKISFINEMANLCERMEGDINEVRRGIGHDQRIGFAFLSPGVGYGGSCFPKDVRALACMAEEHGLEPRILRAVDEVNSQQKHVLTDKVEQHFGDNLLGRTLAIWGLAFKPQTDDIREAPALVMIDRLLARGVNLRVFDPEALANVRAIYGDKLFYAATAMEALVDADGLAINTEWSEFRQVQFEMVKAKLKTPLVFDGRNIYEPDQMRRHGFTYYSIGRLPRGVRGRRGAVEPALLPLQK
ncbi:UDP-glucose dehydrogenase family protein [Lignipirellula cremea]|uniref:UDP-glucose 6-dehydrogenase n=1 Tax=Lignipirellula cremea TaxID=2528010 RepID=A0A518E4M6_9BACT|nr:UDP-glucose/GDP-mannose dehydrogenase family protein [Lignipirellula cremea]QDU99046.1 UDP-glucose 6-dehydrogenase [Lignipirellula cremea]